VCSVCAYDARASAQCEHIQYGRQGEEFGQFLKILKGRQLQLAQNKIPQPSYDYSADIFYEYYVTFPKKFLKVQIQ